MSHFERYEGAEDNLGHKEKEWIPTEDLSVDRQPTPDEILMANEEESFLDPSKTPHKDIEDEKVKVDEKSNWEDDVEEGKYDNYRSPVSKIQIESKPIRTSSRNLAVEIESMSSKEKAAKYWHDTMPQYNNSKPVRPEDDKESIRFDEAV